jgi:hypothetical protein
MWGYQHHYRVHVKSLAQRVFEELEIELHHQVFLVGILQNEIPDRHPACIEPEKECWIESEAFANTAGIAAALVHTYPESQLSHSEPIAEERAKEALHRRSMRDAIAQIVREHPRKPSDVTFYVSWPEMVEGYLVAVVLGVDTNALRAISRLRSSAVPIHAFRNKEVEVSLVDSVIHEILRVASDGLLRPDPGLRTNDIRADEVLRSAGRNLMIGVGYRVDARAFEGAYFLFDSLCGIASLRHEQNEGRGDLILAREQHPLVRRRLTFAGEIPLRDARRARKLLELCRQNRALHVTSENIVGLVEAMVMTEDAEDIFGIRILSHHHWELTHGSDVLMGVRYGEPYLPRPADYESQLRQDFPRVFPGISDNSCDLLITLVRQAEQERHGTLLVISRDAAAEGLRLSGQATVIEPRVLTPDELGDLTGIDGAVLLDETGKCFAIGVILDGVASTSGDPARGARFNSALRYVQFVHKRRIPTIAVVVSEDGGVDLIPKMKPRIRRRLLDELIQELLAFVGQESISFGQYNQVYFELLKHRFYLLQDDCAKVNEAIQAIEKKLREKDPMAIQIERVEFSPRSGMDPEWYYEAESAE